MNHSSVHKPPSWWLFLSLNEGMILPLYIMCNTCMRGPCFFILFYYFFKSCPRWRTMGYLETTALLSFWDYQASNEKNKLLEKIEHNKRKIGATTKLYDQNPGKMTPLRPRSQAGVSSNIAFFSSLYFFYNKSQGPAILNVPFMNGHFPSWYHKSLSCLRRTRVFPRTVKERFCQQEKDDTSKTL